jgi:hypothetical protein
MKERDQLALPDTLAVPVAAIAQRDRADPSASAQQPDPHPEHAAQLAAPDPRDDEEERRRAGRSSGGEMGNPSLATHSLNIRPDVVRTPAGLEVVTAMKSVDYRAQSEEPSQPDDHLARQEEKAALAADLAEARNESTNSRDAIFSLEADDRSKLEDAERAAGAGESRSDDELIGDATLAADLEEARGEKTVRAGFERQAKTDGRKTTNILGSSKGRGGGGYGVF